MYQHGAVAGLFVWWLLRRRAQTASRTEGLTINGPEGRRGHERCLLAQVETLSAKARDARAAVSPIFG
jgi:hypothetical protein